VSDAWICQQCDELGACEICEACERHCIVKTPNDVDAHRRAFDRVLASTASERAPD
jgi:hypothetical protein